jgi:hypothetical protein
MKRTLVLILLVLLLAVLITQIANAEGPATPPPPPVTTPLPPTDPMAAAKAIDAANAEADKWESVARSTMANVQSSINAAYAALAQQQASIYQLQTAFQQADAARLFAQQGQIQQAVESARSAQLASVQSVSLSTQSGKAALLSMQQAGDAARSVAELRSNLTVVTAQRDAARSDAAQLDKDRTALAGALVAERQKSDLLFKVSISFFLLLVMVIVCIAALLWRVVKALRLTGRERLVVVDERGRMKAQIEALN